MSFVQVAILAVIQGLAELLPVSSSAHVIVAEKLFGLDPSAPEMTFLLVMLHTGTMFAVLFYFWPKWRAQVLSSGDKSDRFAFAKALIVATGCTGIVGFGLKMIIEKGFMHGADKAEVEQLFANLPLMATSLAAVGVLIIVSDRWARRAGAADQTLTTRNAGIIGVVQGLCLPFRGFSRSGATISTGMVLRLPQQLAESFSFALAVLLTPAAILLEVRRLFKNAPAGGLDLSGVFGPGLLGMVLSFAAGMAALRWLSSWLESGKWHFFGYYCLAAAAFVAVLASQGY